MTATPPKELKRKANAMQVQTDDSTISTTAIKTGARKRKRGRPRKEKEAKIPKELQQQEHFHDNASEEDQNRLWCQSFASSSSSSSLPTTNDLTTATTTPVISSTTTTTVAVDPVVPKRLQQKNPLPQFRSKGQYYIDDKLVNFAIILELTNKNNFNRKNDGHSSSSSSTNCSRSRTTSNTNNEIIRSLDDEDDDSLSQVIVDASFIRKVSHYIATLWDGDENEVLETNKIQLIIDSNGSRRELELIVRSALYIADSMFYPNNTEKLEEINRDVYQIRHENYNLIPLYSFDLWIQIGEFGHKYFYANDKDKDTKFGQKFELLIVNYFSDKLGLLEHKYNKTNNNKISTEVVVKIFYSKLYPSIRGGLLSSFLKSNPLFNVQIREELTNSMDLKQKQIFEIIRQIEKKDSERAEWELDFEGLIELDQLPQCWNTIMNTHLNHQLPSGKTLKEFILNTFNNIHKIGRDGEKGNAKYDWKYGALRNLLHVMHGRMYTTLNQEEAAVLLSFVQK